MAKTKPGRKDLDSYTIKGTNKVVRPGDCVLMRPSDSDKPPYVAKVEKIEADHRNNVKVRVRWYYRPEESIGGRRQFHGVKELFLSDHYDVQSAHTIEGKCIVHSFKNYTKLDNVGAEDYFCRFEYKAATGGFTPDRVAVYCKCEMPYNPDDLMVQCEGCKDWRWICASEMFSFILYFCAFSWPSHTPLGPMFLKPNRCKAKDPTRLLGYWLDRLGHFQRVG
ncbi:UNVERIFIED_CONTAM: Chromatin remodeling protein EBS [Sesamum radiatum]|uniref:Chromatin remodeling protein EBS n=1 Tax=Sesamum radiatum TaxID=300843 RepID=A0AAW2T8K7_SESRA